jgi:hypothetical protein
MVRSCRLDPGSKESQALLLKARQSLGLIEPKAIYSEVGVRDVLNGQILLEDGSRLDSRLLAKKLICAGRIFPYLITIGPRLEEQVGKLSSSNLLESWVLDKLGTYTLRLIRQKVQERIEGEVGVKVSKFSPGSTSHWDIKQQEVLFHLLFARPQDQEEFGVTLTQSYLMIPKKSVSGIMGKTEREFVECEICPRQCEERRKPYQGND